MRGPDSSSTKSKAQRRVWILAFIFVGVVLFSFVNNFNNEDEMNGTVGIKEGERSTWENVKRMSYSSSSWSSTSNYGDDSISSTQPRYGSESNEDDSAEEIAEAGESNER